MKYYNPNELFLAAMGNSHRIVKNGHNYTHFDQEGFGLFKKSKYSSYEYIDIFSNVTYTNFHSSYCSPGDRAVNSPLSLVSFVQKNYDDYKKIDWLEKIAHKIITSNSVSDSELKELLLVFNGKTVLRKAKKVNTKIYTDLSKKKYKLEPCFGRGMEISELIFKLPEKLDTPILVGEHGVGKTTIIEGLVCKIQKNVVPDFLRKQKIFELNMANLICNSDK